MKLPIIVPILYALPCLCLAEKGQSIMFGDTDPIYQEGVPDTAADEQTAHCKTTAHTDGGTEVPAAAAQRRRGTLQNRVPA